jgi:transcriptional regulator with XRE-family HTH domain
MTAGAGAHVAARQRLARSLAVLRRENGLTASEFEAGFGVSGARAAQVEAGLVMPDKATLVGYLRPFASGPVWHGWLTELRRRHKGGTQLDAAVREVVDFVQHDTARRKRASADLTAYHVPDHMLPPKAVSRADPTTWPAPEKVSTPAEFLEAMSKIKDSTELSYTALADISSRHARPLSRSTIHALCTRPVLPTPRVLGCFIAICGGRPADVAAWHEARQRLAQSVKSPPPPQPEPQPEPQLEPESELQPEPESRPAEVVEPVVPRDSRGRHAAFYAVLWVLSLFVTVLATLVLARPEILGLG